MNELLVKHSIEYLRDRAVHVAGLFTVKSSLTTVKALKQNFDKEGSSVNLSEVENPHIVANLLLHYFRWLDQPLITFALYDPWLEIGKKACFSEAKYEQSQSEHTHIREGPIRNRLPDQVVEDLSKSVRQVICQLPLANRMQMKLLFEFLSQLSITDVNDITSNLLAGVFAPYICNAESRAFMSIRHMEDLPAITCVVQLLIEMFDSIFKEPLVTTATNLPEKTLQHEKRAGDEVMSAAESTNLLKALLSVTVNGLLFSHPLEGDVRVPVHSPGGLTKSFSSSCVITGSSHQKSDAIVPNVENGKTTALGNTSKRRQAVQACRQLKATIKELEYKFAETHGHPPCSVAEKQQAGTHELSQRYRRCKRTIRDDAAASMQALVRGYLVRCRNRSSGGSSSGSSSSSSSKSGNGGSQRERAAKVGAGSDASSVEGKLDKKAIKQLKEEKRDLKQKLKDYDKKFQEQHGRLPTKAEKEPIRWLYEQYNSVKARIAQEEA